jgi:hypothetical protein
MAADGDWLMKSGSVTPVASVITWPDDCAKPSYLEETSTENVITIHGTVRERALTRTPRSSLDNQLLRDAYLLGRTIVVNESGYTTPCTLWYAKRIPDLHTGTAGAGAATSITFEAANFPSMVNDYYNGATIEIVSGTGVGVRTTISDYVVTAGANWGVATTAAGTFSTSSVYGTVSELPDEAIPLVVLDATLLALAKPSSSIDPKYFEYFRSMQRYAEKAFFDWIENQMDDTMQTRITEID